MRRWSDNEKRLGPFTYSHDSYARYGAMLCSGEDEYPGCSLRVHLHRQTLIVQLPSIIKPWRRWVDTSRYKWSGPHLGYWDEHGTEYGLVFSDGFAQVHFGPQTGDSTTTKDWCAFLPWTQWRWVRTSIYEPSGKHFWTKRKAARLGGLDAFSEQRYAKDHVPKTRFSFVDYDREPLEVTTHIEEMEWRFGEKWCSFLSLFRRPKIRRYLALEFSGETGRRKGSWKGGTTGASIEMLPTDTPESAFRRYCIEHSMTFVSALP